MRAGIRIAVGILALAAAALAGGCKKEKPIVGLSVTKNDVAQWGGATNLVGQSKLEGDIEMTVFEGGAAVRGERPGIGEERMKMSTHKRLVRMKGDKVVEVTIIFDVRSVRESDDVYNAFFILANGMAKQVAQIDLAKNDDAFEKLGLSDPTAEGKSVFKVNENVVIVRRVAAGSLKFTAVVPGYTDKT